MLRIQPTTGLAVLVACLLAACATEAPVDAVQSLDITPEDLVFADAGKGDGSLFNVHNLISQSLFEDHAYMSVEEVQAFLEVTPYGTRSKLADLSIGNATIAQIIVANAISQRINPLVLLVKLQVEASLIAREDPSPRALMHGMGCACPDNLPCASAQEGLGPQIACAAAVFRKYLTSQEQSGTTISGWAPDVVKRTQDNIQIIPANQATAALYTYTPWVLVGIGGNWLFWNVLTKYSSHILESRPNYRWIGGDCAQNSGCAYADGICLPHDTGGVCSQTCQKFCPDSVQSNVTGTFCVDLGSALTGDEAGWCVGQCDSDVYPDTGCPADFECVERPRFSDPDTLRSVCIPR